MSSTDVTVNKLVINEITKTQLASTDIPENELILEDPEFTGGKFLKTKADGNIEEVAGINSVSINGTAVTPDSVGNVNIPLASTSNLGVAMVNSGCGISIRTNGVLQTVAASDAEVTAKSNTNKVIVPSNLNKAVMEGLGNNSLTWNQAYKDSACNTIGAFKSSGIQVVGTMPDVPTEGVIYIVTGEEE